MDNEAIDDIDNLLDIPLHLIPDNNIYTFGEFKQWLHKH